MFSSPRAQQSKSVFYLSFELICVQYILHKQLQNPPIHAEHAKGPLIPPSGPEERDSLGDQEQFEGHVSRQRVTPSRFLRARLPPPHPQLHGAAGSRGGALHGAVQGRVLPGHRGVAGDSGAVRPPP